MGTLVPVPSRCQPEPRAQRAAPWPWVSGRRCGAQPREGWGGNRPPQPSPALGGQMGQEWAGAGRSSRPQRPAGRHTWPVTHSQDTQSWITHVEMQMCMCVHAHTHIRYTRTRAHPAHTRHRHSQLTRAHTITHVHTYPAPPAQDLTLTVCTHSNAYRQMQGYAYTQLTHAGIGAHPTHTQT